MVFIKSLLIATLVSGIIATPIVSPGSVTEDLQVVNKVPVIESRGQTTNSGNGAGHGNGNGYGTRNGVGNGFSTSGTGGNCDYSQKQRLDQEIQNRSHMKSQLDQEIHNRNQMKSQLDGEIKRRQGMKQQLDDQIHQRQQQIGHF
ncbi:hypothetical protein LZ30DRAFT_814365 [Colletotrichum cereale]|nr:hypothetical protein LZ30DRAFT_814365 [Colletotrichum cereale]